VDLKKKHCEMEVHTIDSIQLVDQLFCFLINFVVC